MTNEVDHDGETNHLHERPGLGLTRTGPLFEPGAAHRMSAALGPGPAEPRASDAGSPARGRPAGEKSTGMRPEFRPGPPRTLGLRGIFLIALMLMTQKVAARAAEGSGGFLGCHCVTSIPGEMPQGCLTDKEVDDSMNNDLNSHLSDSVTMPRDVLLSKEGSGLSPMPKIGKRKWTVAATWQRGQAEEQEGTGSSRG